MEQASARLTTEVCDGVTIVTLADQRILDEISIGQIGTKLNDIIAAAPQARLIVDFVNVTNMSSSALGMLITLHRRTREGGGDLRLCNIQSTIEEVFRITRLDEIFKILPSRDDALKSLS